MTGIAAFEEREFERPLYAELQVSNNRLWSPGQVLEGRLGFDTAFYSPVSLPHQVYGVASPPGVYLPRHWRFLRKHMQVPAGRKLPNFLLNVFLQAKRPRHLKKPAKDVVAKGITGSHWAFAVDSEQQLILEKLEAKFSGKAIVTYASPVFHTEQALYRHTIQGSVAANSTFPAPSTLSGHKHWHYKRPGATGVAKSEPVAVSGVPLEERIAALAGAEGDASPPGSDDNGWLRNLQLVSGTIRRVMEEGDLPDSFRRARYFELVREIESYAELFPDEQWMSAFLKITAFLSLYKVAWFSVA